MRRSDDMPLDPFETEELAAIEATLEGREVDPRHAELAELTVLLASDQRAPSAQFARELDALVERRFRGAGPESSRPGPRVAPSRLGGSRLGGSRLRSSAPRRAWLRHPAFAAGLTAVLAAVVFVFAVHGGGPEPGLGASATVQHGPASPPPKEVFRVPVSPARPGAPRRVPAPAAGPPAQSVSRAAGQSAGGAAGGPAHLLPLPSASPAGSRQIDSAQLALKTEGRHIDAVTQEILNIVDREHGIVNRSQVTEGRRAGDRYAVFNLGIPDASMQATIDQLSRLRFATVTSRTDSSRNVSNDYQADQRRLADARSLRATLLRELTDAKTIGQADNLQTRIHDVESSISRRQARLRSLQHRISYGALEVQVTQGRSGVTPAKHGGSGSGLTLRRAVHDAVRVLTVAAAVILIGLAAAVPVGLLALLLAWVGFRVRRGRRERALDAA